MANSVILLIIQPFKRLTGLCTFSHFAIPYFNVGSDVEKRELRSAIVRELALIWREFEVDIVKLLNQVNIVFLEQFPNWPEIKNTLKEAMRYFITGEYWEFSGKSSKCSPSIT